MKLPHFTQCLFWKNILPSPKLENIVNKSHTFFLMRPSSTRLTLLPTVVILRKSCRLRWFMNIWTCLVRNKQTFPVGVFDIEKLLFFVNEPFNLV